MSDAAQVIAAVSVLITALAGAVVSIVTLLRVNRVHDEVKTLNESTIGQLAAAVETRRTGAIPHDDRTAQEQRHLDEAPPPDPPQGPSD
jgi:hypothetical protein